MFASSKIRFGENFSKFGGILSFTSANQIPALTGKKILVVDDTQDIQYLESQFLKQAGAEVDFASNGLEAVHKALDGDHDAILMDLHMPILDGLMATQRLRENGYEKPIIAVTADCQQAVRKLAFEKGVNDYISKPLTGFRLLHALEQACTNHKS